MKRILLFQTISENIEKFIKYKINALKAYRSEMRKFPHPRSIENVKSIAKVRGSTVGFRFAEAFRIVRQIKN